MKTLIITLLIGFVIISITADDYIYHKKKISEKKFNKMYTYYQKYLYSDGEKVYNLRNPEKPDTLIKLPFNCKNGDVGSIYGQVFNHIKKLEILINAIFTHEYTTTSERYYYSRIGARSGDGKLIKTTRYIKQKKICYIKGYDASSDIDNANIDVLVVRKGIYNYTTAFNAKKTVDKLIILLPVTKRQFKIYISSNDLYLYKRKRVAAVKCTKCKGKGKIHNKNTKSLMSSPYMKCPECNGNKYAKPETYKWQEKLIK